MPELRSVRTPKCIEDLPRIDLYNAIPVGDRIRAKKDLEDGRDASFWVGVFGSPARIRLVGTKQPRGGLRLWWLCPSCCRRVEYLYADARTLHLVCRRCAGFAYRSQRESGSRRFELVSRHLRTALRARRRRLAHRDGAPRRTRHSARQAALLAQERAAVDAAYAGMKALRELTTAAGLTTPNTVLMAIHAERELAEALAQLFPK